MKIKIILIILTVLLILGFWGFSYLNNVFLPKKLKSILIDALSGQLQRKAELGNLKFRLFKGIVIEGLKIFDVPPRQDAVLLSVKSVNFNFLLIPFLKSKTVIIPSITIDSPSANIKLLADNSLNIPLPQAQKGQFEVFIYRIILDKGKLTFQDQTKTPYFVKEIQDIKSRITLSLPNRLKIDLQASVLNADKTKSRILLKGKYEIKEDALYVESKIDGFNVGEYSPYYANLPLAVSGGRLKGTEINFTKVKDNIGIEYKTLTDSISLSKDEFEATGGINLKGDFNYNLISKEMAYSGFLDLTNTAIEGIPFLKSATNIKGRLDFKNDLLKTSSLTAEALGCPLELSGELTNFNNPSLSLKLESKLDLLKLNDLIKDLTRIDNLKAEGPALLDATISGSLPDALDFQTRLKLLSVRLSTPQLDLPVEQIEGDLTIQKDGVSWQDLSLKYKDQAFKLNGQLKDFASPIIETSLSGRDFNLKTVFGFKDNLVNIASLDGNYLGLKFGLKGGLDIKDTKNPLVNLKGSLLLDLKDAPEIADKFKTDLKPLKARGVLKTTFSLSGPVNDFSRLNISLSGASEVASVYDLKLSGLSLGYNQAEGLGNLKLSSKAYNGNINLLGKLNLSDKDMVYNADLNLESIDISRLKLDTPVKDKNISGSLNARATFSGKGSDLAKLNGSGNISVTEGNLWELNLFKGLGKLLFPQSFEKIVFKNVQGGFTVANKTIFGHTIKFDSDELQLVIEGTCDFAGNLNAKAVTKFSEELVKEDSQTLEKIVGALLSQAQQYVAVKITGTLTNPKYKVQPQVENIIEGIFKIFN
ncbi:MAG: AsmA-like C-terminal region-containing protein [Candidatus Omnitrophota bacterium]